MVAIEHRQKSAIIATDTSTTETSTTANTNLTTAAATTTTSSPRRSSDIVNSNDISVLSPPSNASSTPSTATTTTNTKTTGIAASNIVVVIPLHDTKDHEHNVESNTSPNLNKRLSKMSQSSSEASTVTAESAAAAAKQQQLEADLIKRDAEPVAGVSKSAVSQRNVDIKIAKKSNKDSATQELTKKVLKLDLSGKEIDEFSIKSPKSPIATRLPHQTSLTTVDVEDRKTLREALYHGIFHRHRRTIFAVGSFLRMLRSRNSSYNTIRSSSEGEDIDEVR